MRKIIFFFCFTILGNATFAQSSIRAKQYATEYGKFLMNKYGTDDAKNCTTAVVEAETEDSDYIMEIEVSWDDIEGAIFKDDVKCIIKGVLTVKTDGTNKRFSETYRNDAFAKIAKGKKRRENFEKVGEKILESSLNSKSSSPVSQTNTTTGDNSSNSIEYFHKSQINKYYEAMNEYDFQKLKMLLDKTNSNLLDDRKSVMDINKTLQVKYRILSIVTMGTNQYKVSIFVSNKNTTGTRNDDISFDNTDRISRVYRN